jgi:hypothetical protein
MTIVNDLLQQRPGLGLPQRTFLATWFVTILVRRGRVNFRPLSRDCDDAERPIARQFREPFDWPAFHQRVLMTGLDPRSAVVSAPDASFIPQRGQQTCGLGPFVNGWASRAERGWERSTRAVVEVTRRCALTRAVAQTPPAEKATKAAPAESRVDFSTPPRRAPRPRLPPRMISHGVDGYEAKKPSLDEVVSRKLHAITTRRSDADCGLLYTGPHPQRRGARRPDDGKVTFQALSRCEDLGTMADAPQLPLYTAVVWHKTLQRRWRLGGLRHRTDPVKPRFIVLGSTETALHGRNLIEL